MLGIYPGFAKRKVNIPTILRPHRGRGYKCLVHITHLISAGDWLTCCSITGTLSQSCHNAQNQLIVSELRRQMTKPTKWHMRPAKTQISLGIRPVSSESLLSTWKKLGSLATHWAHSKHSDQTWRMPRLIWVFAGRTLILLGFVMRRLTHKHLDSLATISL